MADVGVTLGEDRAQLLIVGALALAVSLVALGLILNFAIYTENIATRDGNHDASEAAQYAAMTTESVGQALRHVNVDVKDSSKQKSALDREITLLNEHHGRYGASDGSIVDIRTKNRVKGTRIRQDDETRNFTDDAGVSEWTLATGVGETTRFHQDIKRGGLFEMLITQTKDDLRLNGYHVTIRDSVNGVLGDGDDEMWRVYVFQDSLTDFVYLTVQDPSETFTGNPEAFADFITETCITRKPVVNLGLVHNEFGGDPNNPNDDCAQLSFFEDDPNTPTPEGQLSAEYKIMYNNTATVTGATKGTYDILVDKTPVDQSPYASVGSGNDPIAYEAFFRATVLTTYRSEDTSITTRRNTGPVASLTDFPGFNPEIIRFEVTDTSTGGVSSKAEFEVTWEVEDRDANLQEVRLILTKKSDDDRKDSDTVTVSGDHAGPNTTILTHSGGDDSGEIYFIRTRVIDQDGNVVSRTKEEAADGA